jgi:bifunctional non-homologous end joining protein LigD
MKTAPRTLPQLQPMLAKLGTMPSSPGYAFEFKWDGYRALCYWDGRRLRLESRNGLDLTPQFPELLSLSRQIREPLILDGEICAFDSKGRANFQMLQNRMGFRMRADRGINISYMIFDILHLGRRSLLNKNYLERRQALESLGLRGNAWNTPSSYPDGDALLSVAESHGYEGIMAKRTDSDYVPGRRSDAWIKIKLHRRQEFVIGGWLPGLGILEQSIGALLIGYYEGDRLRFAGKVGTGFTFETRTVLKEYLLKVRRHTSPFADKVPLQSRANFVEPIFVCEVEFTEWTDGTHIRHPSFKGLRTDKDPTQIRKEE